MKMAQLVRHGHKDRVRFLESGLIRSVLPTQLARIRQNDKTVLKELVLPPWLDWDTLYEWSFRVKPTESGTECILCNKNARRGTTFENKFICDECLFKIRGMQ